MGMFERVGRALGLAPARTERKSFEMGELGRWFGGAPARSGVSVTHDTAIKVATVFACARVKSQSLARLPLKLIQAQGDARATIANHPAAQLITQPNAFMSRFEFLETMGLHLALAGNFYAMKTPIGGGGRPRELLPLLPGWVSVRTNGFEPRYDVRPQNGVPVALDLGPEDIWHVRGPSWNGTSGYEPLVVAREAIGLAIASEGYASQLFAQGVRPSGAFEAPPGDQMSAEQRAEFTDQVRELYAGLNNAGGAMLLEGGMKWVATAMTADDAQTIDQRRFAVEEVCRFMGVAPLLVYASDKAATYASAEAFFAQHDEQSTLPDAMRVEQSADLALLTTQDLGDGLGFRFTLDAVARASLADRTQYYAAALGAGGHQPWRTVNEIRRLEDLPPVEGGDGLPERAGAQSGGQDERT